MKWFKHMSDMLEDPIVSAVMTKFKDKGYAVINGIFELYAKYCGDNPGKEVHIPWKKIEDSLYLKRSTVTQVMLEYASVEARLKLDRDPNEFLQFSSTGLELKIRIPKMQTLKDNYTKDSKSKLARGLQETGKKVSLDKDKEEDKEIDPTLPPKGEGEDFEKNSPKADPASTAIEPPVDQSDQGLVDSCRAVRVEDGNPNLCTVDWVPGFIRGKAPEIRRLHPSITDESIVSLWREACVISSAKAVGSPKYYMTTFESLFKQYKPENNNVVSIGGSSGRMSAFMKAHIEELMSAKKLVSVFGEELDPSLLYLDQNEQLFIRSTTNKQDEYVQYPRHWSVKEV